MLFFGWYAIAVTMIATPLPFVAIGLGWMIISLMGIDDTDAET